MGLHIARAKLGKSFPIAIAIMMGVGLLSLPVIGYSGPAMYWWHKPFSGSQSACVAKARHIMPGHDDKPNGAFYSTSEITAAVKCINHGTNPLVVLIVTGNSGDTTKRMFDGLKRRMFG